MVNGWSKREKILKKREKLKENGRLVVLGTERGNMTAKGLV
jgi:hypothetical protein